MYAGVTSETPEKIAALCSEARLYLTSGTYATRTRPKNQLSVRNFLAAGCEVDNTPLCDVKPSADEV